MNIYKKRIERLMKERGMSNKTLSNKLGVSQSYVSQILSEKQYRGIGRNTLVKLANIFHVPVDVLLSAEILKKNYRVIGKVISEIVKYD